MQTPKHRPPMLTFHPLHTPLRPRKFLPNSFIKRNLPLSLTRRGFYKHSTPQVLSNEDFAKNTGGRGAPTYSHSGNEKARAVERLITKYTHLAARTCPSLKRKNVSPHVLRHSTAMDLLHHGVDRSVIALWLGHESVETTQMYLHADMRLKEKALSRTEPTAFPEALLSAG
jgi:integrase